MTTHLVLDIETIPDPEFPWEPTEKEKIAPPPQHKVVALGCFLLENYVPKKLGLVGEGEPEGAMLEGFAAWLTRARPTVVTWNGRGFDLPVLTSRMLHHGVPMPYWYSSKDTRYRFSTEGHFDMMDFLADFGASRNMKLDLFAKLIGFPGKLGIDGSQVAGMVAEGRLHEVSSYCLCDVAQTAAVLLRVDLLRGKIARSGYPELAKGLLSFYDAEPRLKPLSEAIRRERFVLSSVTMKEGE